MFNYDAYQRSDSGGQQLILRQVFDRIKALEDDNKLLRQEVEDLKRPKNPLHRLGQNLEMIEKYRRAQGDDAS